MYCSSDATRTRKLMSGYPQPFVRQQNKQLQQQGGFNKKASSYASIEEDIDGMNGPSGGGDGLSKDAKGGFLISGFALTIILLFIAVIIGGITLEKTMTLNDEVYNVSLVLEETLSTISVTEQPWVVYGKSRCRHDIGLDNITNSSMTAELASVLAFDRDLKANAAFFPGIVGSFPLGITGAAPPFWTLNYLDTDEWVKDRSLAHALGFFADISLFTTPPSDYRITLFVQNIADRGFQDDSPVVKNQLSKRVYQAAMTMDKIMNRYAPTIKAATYGMYRATMTSKKPFLSAMKEYNENMFMDLHFGVKDHPFFVREWFGNFSYVTSGVKPNPTFTFPPGVEARVNATLIYGKANAECVRQYARESMAEIRRDGNTCAMPYHWMIAGMPYETVNTEAIHNKIAFDQLDHTAQLIIEQSLAPGPGTGGLSYFDLFRMAGSEEAEINVIREIFRLELPNPASLSRKKSAPGIVQGIHIRKLIEIIAEGGNPNVWGAFNTTRYANFTARFSDFITYDTVYPTQRCPFGYTDTDSFMKQSVKDYTYSPLDNRTILNNGEEQFIPVYPTPKYGPFDWGTKRCPGEKFTMYYMWEWMHQFKCAIFYKNPSAPTASNYIALGPYKYIPDIYFVNTTHSKCGYAQTAPAA